jgi:antitoxin (DNA-binding transcriptional repressor) of toxin-antitoxin stability system
MDGVTLREASETLPELIARVEKGEEVVITRDGVPVARLVREAAAAPGERRVLTPEQEAAVRRNMAMLEEGWPIGIGQFDREEIYADRLMRQHKPWRD